MADVEQDMLFLGFFDLHYFVSRWYFLIHYKSSFLFCKMANALSRQKPNDFAPKLDHVAPGSTSATLS